MMSPMDQLDTPVGRPARRCDFRLGGKDNSAADRKPGRKN
jgi:hypothetical protein